MKTQGSRVKKGCCSRQPHPGANRVASNAATERSLPSAGTLLSRTALPLEYNKGIYGRHTAVRASRAYGRSKAKISLPSRP